MTITKHRPRESRLKSTIPSARGLQVAVRPGNKKRAFAAARCQCHVGRDAVPSFILYLMHAPYAAGLLSRNRSAVPQTVSRRGWSLGLQLMCPSGRSFCGLG